MLGPRLDNHLIGPLAHSLWFAAKLHKGLNMQADALVDKNPDIAARCRRMASANQDICERVRAQLLTCGYSPYCLRDFIAYAVEQAALDMREKDNILNDWADAWPVLVAILNGGRSEKIEETIGRGL